MLYARKYKEIEKFNNGEGIPIQKPELLLKDLELGREFSPFEFKITKEMVKDFMDTTGDYNPFYYDEQAAKAAGFAGPIAPPALANIFGRQAYLQDYIMPGGGILARQDLEFFFPARVGETLTIVAQVIERYVKREKNYVTIQSIARNEEERVVAIVRVNAIWPK